MKFVSLVSHQGRLYAIKENGCIYKYNMDLDYWSLVTRGPKES